MAKINLISLGCPKNLVDSEGALGEMIQAGHEIVSEESRADVIIVNTCGFIESAREESIEAILDAVECKQSGNCRAIIVIGCLSQRFPDELARELNEVDAFLGIEHIGKINAVIEDALEGERRVEVASPPEKWVEQVARVQSTPHWMAYLKISDGCDNRCAYCAIPDIRGPFRSRPETLIVEEAKRLADQGVKELVLVGQDATQYGSDLEREVNLPSLIEKLNEIEPLHWIRLMYCYPSKVTRELIDTIASSEKVVKYLDMPLQHGDDDVLKAMNRRGRSEDYLRVIDQLREAMPEIALRTTFIVGFPGETSKAFENLLAFVKRIRFDRVGAFIYSPEEGTPAAIMKPRLSQRKAAERLEKLMLLQQEISLERNREFVGKNLEVLVEGETTEGAHGRSYRDAPEIDGVVYLPSGLAKAGDFVQVKVTEATEYDLVAS